MLKLRLFAAGATLFLGAGCVPLTDYQKLEDRYKEQEKYVQRNKDLVKELERREQVLTLEAKERQNEKETLMNRLAKSEHARAELEAAMKRKGFGGTVAASSQAAPPPVDGGWRINSETGGIVLGHDLLFASGSHVLKDSGKKLISEIVSKLQGPEYSKYQIRIDGHTDNQPVVRTKKENNDNWDLGYKRAKAVFEFMVSKGISEKRCFLADFGPTLPLSHEASAPVTTKHVEHHAKGEKHHEKHHHEGGEGRPEDRRVEIVLFERKV